MGAVAMHLAMGCRRSWLGHGPMLRGEVSSLLCSEAGPKEKIQLPKCSSARGSWWQQGKLEGQGRLGQAGAMQHGPTTAQHTRGPDGCWTPAGGSWAAPCSLSLLPNFDLFSL